MADASALLCVVVPVLASIVVGWLLLYDGSERRRMVRGVLRRLGWPARFWNAMVDAKVRRIHYQYVPRELIECDGRDGTEVEP